MRITAVIPCFALLAFGGIYLGESAIYLAPWLNVCESIALLNFFLLLCAYLSPRADGRKTIGEEMSPPRYVAPTAAAAPPPAATQVRTMVEAGFGRSADSGAACVVPCGPVHRRRGVRCGRHRHHASRWQVLQELERP